MGYTVSLPVQVVYSCADMMSADVKLLMYNGLLLQKFFLNSRHLQQLKEEYGVEPWHFEQHPGEGVFIPAGCPHQVPLCALLVPFAFTVIDLHPALNSQEMVCQHFLVIWKAF